MLDEMVRERDEARAEIARLRAAIAEVLRSSASDSGVRSGSRPLAQGRPTADGYDPELMSAPCYGIIALGCERARQEAIAEALELE